MNLQNRIARLEAAMSSDGECPECFGPLVREILAWHPGQPAPDVPTCPTCGQPRGDVLILEHVIVNSDGNGG